jgi:hypothetical protein
MSGLPAEQQIAILRLNAPAPTKRRSRGWSLFDIAVGIELFEVGPKVVDLLIVLDAGENHFRTRDFGLGILDVFIEGRLIPDDARFLVGIGILVIRDATGLAAVQAVLCRTDLVLRTRTDAMADQTFLERSPLAISCAIPASVDVAISATATISVFVIMRRFPFGAGPALGGVGHTPFGRKFDPQQFKRRRQPPIGRTAAV